MNLWFRVKVFVNEGPCARILIGTRKKFHGLKLVARVACPCLCKSPLALFSSLKCHRCFQKYSELQFGFSGWFEIFLFCFEALQGLWTHSVAASTLCKAHPEVSKVYLGFV